MNDRQALFLLGVGCGFALALTLTDAMVRARRARALELRRSAELLEAVIARKTECAERHEKAHDSLSALAWRCGFYGSKASA